jgi:hypothetical protein
MVRSLRPVVLFRKDDDLAIWHHRSFACPLTSNVKWADDSKDRASGDPDDLLLCVVGRVPGDLHPSQKTRMCILPHFHPSTVPDVPRQLVPHRPAYNTVGSRQSGFPP